ncbi:MAG: GerMN domain-containing protein [Clostridiales bacterium]|nr:GerMN domain-containing protein [Clostridiales bacterium]
MSSWHTLVFAEGRLGFEAPDNKRQVDAVLYFRYQDSPYLTQEIRRISVKHTESLEKALVQALLDGPEGASNLAVPLFPRGTEVLNVLEENGRLFVTFSKQAQEPMGNENTFSQLARDAAILRRRLAMASLVNTLTEFGKYRDVQVLILNDPGLSTSMRLSARYYLENSDDLPGPLTRDEDAIITPGKALAHILHAWQQQNWQRLLKLVAVTGEEMSPPMKMEEAQDFPTLLEMDVSEGRIAPHGSSAIVALRANILKKNGESITLFDFPVLMLRNHQGWMLSLSSLQGILEASK